jgi:TIR domain/Pentapeptide repeats (8 copies)
MANPEHVALVRQGADAIAEWRQRQPGARLDLSGADLRGMDLRHADLGFADLEAADLSQADLRAANLAGAKLIEADLSRADLSNANLIIAILRYADLSNAILTSAQLVHADLTLAVLDGAVLADAELAEADLEGASVIKTSFRGAKFGYTRLPDIDLSTATGLASAMHYDPSLVGVRTLIDSVRGAGNKLTRGLEKFFRGAGVPQELLSVLPKIVSDITYLPCFISYGQPDLRFAKRLRDDLVARGVSCWLYDADKTVGRPTWSEIEEKLVEYEWMVVLCSVRALIRDGFKKEVDKQIDKNPNKLIPVSLDDDWKQDGFRAEWAGRDLKAWLLDRNYADFASKPYEEALEELLKGLMWPKTKRSRTSKRPP